MGSRAEIPYRSQYASPDLAAELQSGAVAFEDDPRWREFGASTPGEYRRWARCGCGMACLQMILAARGGEVPPLAELGRRAIPYGAYEAEPPSGFGPLIYAGFVDFAAAEFGLQARVAAPLGLEELAESVAGDEVVLASVSAEIRAPATARPTRAASGCSSRRSSASSPAAALPSRCRAARTRARASRAAAARSAGGR